jgi:hypothetical protein
MPPNQALQQTAAAILVSRSSLGLSAAAAAERCRSAPTNTVCFEGLNRPRARYNGLRHVGLFSSWTDHGETSCVLWESCLR